MRFLLHPDEYKRLWWMNIIEIAHERHGAFTVQDIIEIIYECSAEQQIDYRNMHRALMMTGLIQKTNSKVANDKGTGRPAVLYAKR